MPFLLSYHSFINSLETFSRSLVQVTSLSIQKARVFWGIFLPGKYGYSQCIPTLSSREKDFQGHSIVLISFTGTSYKWVGEGLLSVGGNGQVMLSSFGVVYAHPPKNPDFYWPPRE